MPAIDWTSLMTSAEEGAKEFALLAPAMYSFVIKDAAKVGETSKGNPKFTINPSVESGERANARVFHDFSVSDNAYAMKTFFFGDLAILGLGPDFFAGNPSEEQLAQALQGRRFVAEVFHEESSSNQRTYARLRNFAPATGAAPGVGVPGGLPAASAPVAASAPAPAAPSASPWGTTPAASAPTNAVQMPPAFG